MNERVRELGMAAAIFAFTLSGTIACKQGSPDFGQNCHDYLGQYSLKPDDINGSDGVLEAVNRVCLGIGVDPKIAVACPLQIKRVMPADRSVVVEQSGYLVPGTCRLR